MRKLFGNGFGVFLKKMAAFTSSILVVEALLIANKELNDFLESTKQLRD